MPRLQIAQPTHPLVFCQSPCNRNSSANVSTKPQHFMLSRSLEVKWTPISEWYIARFVNENGRQKNMYYDKGGLLMCLKCTNHSRFNRECLHDHLKRKRINTSTTYSQLQGLQFVNRRVYDSIQWLGLKLNKLLTIIKAEESFREAN